MRCNCGKVDNAKTLVKAKTALTLKTFQLSACQYSRISEFLIKVVGCEITILFLSSKISISSFSSRIQSRQFQLLYLSAFSIWCYFEINCSSFIRLPHCPFQVYTQSLELPLFIERFSSVRTLICIFGSAVLFFLTMTFNTVQMWTKASSSARRPNSSSSSSQRLKLISYVWRSGCVSAAIIDNDNLWHTVGP